MSKKRKQSAPPKKNKKKPQGIVGQDVARFKNIVAIVGRHGLHHLLNKDPNTENLPPDATFGDAMEQEKVSYAVRFRMLLEELGTTYIKFGQILSTRPDMLSPELVSELSKLQDHCQPMSAEDTAAQLQDAYHRPIKDIFKEFDETPVASASISQVHRAVLPNGDVVAVKIQRRGLLEKVRADLDILYYLATLLEAIMQATGFSTPRSIVKEFEISLLKELDFPQEAQTIKRFYENARQRDGVVIPKVYGELCNNKVVVMQFLTGRSMKSLNPQKDPELCRKLGLIVVDTTLAQIFDDGLYHADPHPGNILVLDDGRLGLLDFGAVGELTPTMRDTCLAFLMSIVLQDADAMTRLIYRITTTNERLEIRTLRSECSTILHRHLDKGGKLGEISASKVIEDVSALITKHQLQVPSEYAVVIKAALTLEGVMMALDPTLDIMERAKPYLQKVMTDRFKPDDLHNLVIKEIFDVGGIFNDVPTSMAQVLMDLEHGHLTVNTANEELSRLTNAITNVGMLLFVGLIASSVISGVFATGLAQTASLVAVILIATGFTFSMLILFTQIACRKKDHHKMMQIMKFLRRKGTRQLERNSKP